MAYKLGDGLMLDDMDSVLVKTRTWLDRYFAGERPCPHDLVSRAKATEF